ncbi:MAG: hypothetical protein KBT34_05465 [Prevotella sp.]|nr:hypothetical protein [Candidatus Prevotella equi]
MKEKIFNLLKQEYSHLGLGDEILQGQATLLAKTGLVTDTNLDSIIKLQKEYLEDLQKLNDKRATDAAEKAREKAKKEFEDARKKAEEEEAKRKAEEEERRKKEMENQEIPEAIKKLFAERDEQAKKEREQSQALIKQLTEQLTANKSNFDEIMAKTNEETKSLLEKYNAMKDENDKAKAEIQKRQRMDFIASKAKELNIPQYRIDEGFNIKDDDDETKIIEYLTTVSNNIKTNLLPQDKRQQLNLDDKPSKEEVDAIAKLLVK